MNLRELNALLAPTGWATRTPGSSRSHGWWSVIPTTPAAWSRADTETYLREFAGLQTSHGARDTESLFVRLP